MPFAKTQLFLRFTRFFVSCLAIVFLLLCFTSCDARADETGSIGLSDYTIYPWDPIYMESFYTGAFAYSDPSYPYKGGVMIHNPGRVEGPPPFEWSEVGGFHAIFVNEGATTTDWCATFLAYISDLNLPWLQQAGYSSYTANTYEFWLHPGFMWQTQTPGVVSWDLLLFNEINRTNVRLEYLFADVHRQMGTGGGDDGGDDGPGAVVTPEPATWSMLLLGATGVVFVRRKKKN